jgi:hypothetical protein
MVDVTEINFDAPGFDEKYRGAHAQTIQGVPPKGATFRAEQEYGDACVFVALVDKLLRKGQRKVTPNMSFSKGANPITSQVAPASEIDALTQTLQDFISGDTRILRRQPRPVVEKLSAFLKGEIIVPKESIAVFYDLVGKVDKITQSKKLKNICALFKKRLGVEHSKQEWRPNRLAP